MMETRIDKTVDNIIEIVEDEERCEENKREAIKILTTNMVADAINLWGNIQQTSINDKDLGERRLVDLQKQFGLKYHNGRFY